jgi:hypothetical protein
MVIFGKPSVARIGGTWKWHRAHMETNSNKEEGEYTSEQLVKNK